MRPYKFVVQAVVQVVDGDGKVTGESAADPVTVFGVAELAEWAERFPDELAKAGVADGVPRDVR